MWEGEKRPGIIDTTIDTRPFFPLPQIGLGTRLMSQHEMSNCAERHLDVYTSSAFHIRILQQNGDYHLSYAGSVDCLSLKLLLWNLLGQGVTDIKMTFDAMMWSWMLLAPFSGLYAPGGML